MFSTVYLPLCGVCVSILSLAFAATQLQSLTEEPASYTPLLTGFRPRNRAASQSLEWRYELYRYLAYVVVFGFCWGFIVLDHLWEAAGNVRA